VCVQISGSLAREGNCSSDRYRSSRRPEVYPEMGFTFTRIPTGFQVQGIDTLHRGGVTRPVVAEQKCFDISAAVLLKGVDRHFRDMGSEQHCRWLCIDGVCPCFGSHTAPKPRGRPKQRIQLDAGLRTTSPIVRGFGNCTRPVPFG